NHDKMYEATLERYLSAFWDLPSQPPFVRSIEIRGMRFLFFGIDSNAYDEGNVGIGEISEATVGWLGEQIECYRGHRDCLRVLLLHHHPADLNQFRRHSWVDALKGRFTLLRGNERLLALCRDEIDVIMHGHEHFPVAFEDPVSRSVIVSAG